MLRLDLALNTESAFTRTGFTRFKVVHTCRKAHDLAGPADAEALRGGFSCFQFSLGQLLVVLSRLYVYCIELSNYSAAVSASAAGSSLETFGSVCLTDFSFFSEPGFTGFGLRIMVIVRPSIVGGRSTLA